MDSLNSQLTPAMFSQRDSLLSITTLRFFAQGDNITEVFVRESRNEHGLHLTCIELVMVVFYPALDVPRTSGDAGGKLCARWGEEERKLCVISIAVIRQNNEQR